MVEVNFHLTAKPLFVLSSIFGLGPVSSFNRYQRNIYTCLNIFWTLLWTLSITTFVVFDSYFTLKELTTQPMAIQLVSISYFLSLFLAIIINLLNNIFIRNNFPIIFSKFCEADKRLFSNSDVIIYRRERFIVVKDIIIVIIISVLTQIGFCWMFGFHSIGRIIIYSFEQLPLFLNTIVTLQFKFWVRQLNQRLKIIKNYLVKYTNHHQTDIIRTFRSSKVVNFLDCTDVSSRQFVKHARNIQWLRHVYSVLFETKQLVNSTYAVPNVCQLITCYVTCVGALYWGIHAVSSHTDEVEALVCFVICGYVLLLLAWVLLNCHRAREEANKIVIYIQKVTANSRFSKVIEDDLMKFVSQVRDTPIEFTPCGLFTLNLSLLCSTIGVICTYSIIMFQIGD
ncbi:hypothetical protein L9F63_014813 [Diploptera punctata]|uniref:Gustatory receptor n=1 Tax=Diploptera punctata TaxID=6984 RepID=A0AAD8EK72_DIPPU|nr:hypothetical protein L9F63_014813 [Diploptera punctata]